MDVRNKPRLATAMLIVSHGSVVLAAFWLLMTPLRKTATFRLPRRLAFISSTSRSNCIFVRFSINGGQTKGLTEAITKTGRWLTRYAFLFQGIFSAPIAPGKIFLAGTDAYGRDQFSRFLYGGRISLFAGLMATVISLSLGTLLGGIAGFYGCWVDELIMRTAEIFLAVPWLYLLFAVRAFLPLEITPNAIFLLLITVMGAIGWARPARLIRGVVLSAKERDYVLAAKGFGASDIYLMRRHVLPQAFSVALTQAALLIPRYVLAEVVLSFFGLGVSEPAPSWGNLLANLRQYDVLESYWWMFLPALALIPVFLAYYSLFSYYGYYSSGGTLVARPDSERVLKAVESA